MELSAALARVQKLINLAEHENTGEAEAKLAREQADAIMLKYAIDEAALDATRPIAQQAKPAIIWIQLTDGESGLLGDMARLARYVARYCRCMIRAYDRYNDQDDCWESKVYGYESDLRYFEYLYTTLRLHMVGALRPSVDPSVSLEDNAYRFHSAGYNWLEIAAFYGWRKADAAELSWAEIEVGKEIWVRGDERQTNFQTGSHFKRAYQRACKAKGEAPQAIPAGGSKQYRKDAVSAYATRIDQRLRDIEGRREVGSALVLRTDALKALWEEDNPTYTVTDEDRARWAADLEAERNCQRCKAAKGGKCREHYIRKLKDVPFSEAGYEAGRRQADTADLNKAASGTKHAIS